MKYEINNLIPKNKYSGLKQDEGVTIAKTKKDINTYLELQLLNTLQLILKVQIHSKDLKYIKHLLRHVEYTVQKTVNIIFEDIVIFAYKEADIFSNGTYIKGHIEYEILYVEEKE